MKKEYIVILLLLLVFYFYSKKAKATPPPAPEPEKPSEGGISVQPNEPIRKTWEFTYYRVKAGDTLYKICRDNINLDKVPEYIKTVNESFPDMLKTEKDFILYYAQFTAETNGFDWNLQDNKVTNNALDPDTLIVKQKLTIFSPDSYELINIHGPLFGGVQYVQGWDLLPETVWGTRVRLGNNQALIDSFKNNPPKNV